MVHISNRTLNNKSQQSTKSCGLLFLINSNPLLSGGILAWICIFSWNTKRLSFHLQIWDWLSGCINTGSSLFHKHINIYLWFDLYLTTEGVSWNYLFLFAPIPLSIPDFSRFYILLVLIFVNKYRLILVS